LISYCDSDIDSMTPCVLEAYGKMFGSDYNNVVDLKMALSTTAGKGKDFMTKLTGCKQPCKGTKYDIVIHISVLRKMTLHYVSPSRDLQISLVINVYFFIYFFVYLKRDRRFKMLKFELKFGYEIEIEVSFV
jgi:hypothetical protein